MNAGVNRRLLAVWLVLSSITLAYAWLDHSADHAGVLTANTAVTSSAIVLALIKVRIIFQEFMEVRHAPVLLRRLSDAWVVLIAAILLGSYFISMAIW